jgi:20S proteasome subunit beta 2
MDVVTYAALGSGGLAATGVLESRYPKIGSGSCSLEEGMRLAVDAVTAGVKNDLGSGSRVDVCIIAKEGVLYRRAVVKEEVLEWMVRQEDLIDVTAEKRPRGSSGVNGFGNVPFAIQSEKVVISGEVLAEKARRRWMDKIIGPHE